MSRRPFDKTRVGSILCITKSGFYDANNRDFATDDDPLWAVVVEAHVTKNLYVNFICGTATGYLSDKPPRGQKHSGWPILPSDKFSVVPPDKVPDYVWAALGEQALAGEREREHMISNLAPGDLVRVTRYSQHPIAMVATVTKVKMMYIYLQVLSSDRWDGTISSSPILLASFTGSASRDTYERVTHDQLTDKEHQAIAERALLNGAG